MSSTRYAKQGSPISDERYMSSPELARLRGINATAVAARCKVLASPVKRELLFFLQAISMKDDGGGLIRLAEELVKMFPKRIGTPTMHRIGMEGQIKYSGRDLHWVESEIRAGLPEQEDQRLARLLMHDGFGDETRYEMNPEPCQVKLTECREAAINLIPEFVIELCVNPKMQFRVPGEDVAGSLKAGGKLRKQNPVDYSSITAELQQFQDVIGALFEYKRQYENSARAGFCQTAISRKIWTELDAALKTRTMCLINGLPGRGKTEAVRAWCECHLGVARFVSLDGTSTKTAHFRELAKALGVGHGASRKAQEMQCTVKEILQSSGIMPVIDEAHFFFEQSARITSRPAMLDWIDTALCNPPIPVALITTPQFMTCLERAAIQAEWNYLQFQRRCKRTVELPSKNTPEDVKAVAKHLLPSADANTIRLILGYEKLTVRDLSAVGDTVRNAKRIAEESGDGRVRFEHVDQAINELGASDQPWAVLRRRVQEGLLKKKSGRRIAAALDMQPDGSREAQRPRQGFRAPEPVEDQASAESDQSRGSDTAPAQAFRRQVIPEQTRDIAPAELNHATV